MEWFLCKQTITHNPCPWFKNIRMELRRGSWEYKYVSHCVLKHFLTACVSPFNIYATILRMCKHLFLFFQVHEPQGLE